MPKFQTIMESNFEVIALEQGNQTNDIIMKINKLQVLSYIYIHNLYSTDLGFGINALWIGSSSNVYSLIT